MSLDLAKLRLLQRQAGRTQADAPPPAASPAAALTAAVAPTPSAPASAGHRHAADAQGTRRADASAPLFEKQGLGEIRSSADPPAPLPRASATPNQSRIAASDIPFLDDALDDAQPRPASTDAAQLRRLIALRERKPGADIAASPAVEPASPATAPPSPAPSPAAAPPPRAESETPSRARGPRTDIDALRRLIALRERKPTPSAAIESPPVAAGSAASPARRSLDRSLPGEEIAPGLYYLQAHLPLPVPASALSLAFAKRGDESVEPQRLLFFDTETTGLAGGTGTRAFMIGAADWQHDPGRGAGLRIRQLTIASLAAEPAMLREFAGWLRPDTVLSSYNGRCYDAPLLNARYRLARQPNPLLGLDHVDLLFPTRRLYRGVWENCKLATIERELLRILREDDLPGAQAPAAWLQYLRGGSAALLRRVIAHNHQDVATLAQLLPRLVQAHAELAPSG
ncbi:ribonuclease H-like domain-containing protein [Lysobacter sp. BMK333-48F3]|nr:ribonuclease H-like domain-containing protein [Lysobacter sp. BMK333-48F3]